MSRRRYFDVTSDGEDEAIVIIKIETTGSAVPQIVYVSQGNKTNPNLSGIFAPATAPTAG